MTEPEHLALLNQTLYNHRTIAAAAAPTPFHILLDHLFQRSILRRCFTANFDGLEGKTTPGMLKEDSGPAVVHVLGANEGIHCEQCKNSYAYEEFQSELAGSGDLECPSCLSVARK
jgi:NAD-dependent SIR2 family protein deacetylase